MDHIPSIGSVMTPFPCVVQVNESVLAARALMVEHEVRHLPVKDGSTLIGVLTDRDLKRAFDPSLGLPPKEELFVRDVFIPDAYIVDVVLHQRPHLSGRRARWTASIFVLTSAEFYTGSPSSFAACACKPSIVTKRAMRASA